MAVAAKMVEDCRKAKALPFSDVDDKSVSQLVNYDGQRGSFPLSVIVLLFPAVDSSIPRPLKEQGGRRESFCVFVCVSWAA